MCMCCVEHMNPKKLLSKRQQFLKPSKCLLLISRGMLLGAECCLSGLCCSGVFFIQMAAVVQLWDNKTSCSTSVVV